jgi:hypothetical protein
MNLPRTPLLATCRLLVALAVAGLLAARPAALSAADAVVGTGSAASCTETAFDSTLAAVQGSAGGVITFSCGSSPHTILLTTPKFISADVELHGGDLVTLSGGNATALFQIYGGAALTLTGITLTRGYGVYGAIENFGTLTVRQSRLVSNEATGDGGAILNHGSLSLVNSTVSENKARKLGGGVLINAGSAVIVGSQFRDNRTTLATTASDGGGGAGVAVASGATLTVEGSTFSGNTTTATFAQGGGISSAGTITVSNSLLTLNSASRGGGIAVLGGTATVTGSTFHGNLAVYGGGIRQTAGSLTVAGTSFTRNGYQSDGLRVTTGGGGLSWDGGTAELTDVTISDNWASYGGGFDHANGTTRLTNVTISGNAAVGGGGFDQGAGSITLVNATVAGNSAPFFAGGIASRGGTISLANTLLAGNVHPDTGRGSNCSKTLAPSNFSLSSDLTCGFGAGRDDVDVKIGPLAANGGPVLTHLPLRGSPAIDTGGGGSCPASDARGTTRPQGQACDIGAVEVTADDLLLRIYLPGIGR